MGELQESFYGAKLAAVRGTEAMWQGLEMANFFQLTFLFHFIR